jgi:hypothetical protein
MLIEVVVVDTAGEAEECGRILGTGYLVLAAPLRPLEIPSSAACCYLMCATGGEGELRCLRALQVLTASGFPIERIYRVHCKRPIGKRTPRASFEAAFRRPAPVDRNLAESHALLQTLRMLIGQNAVNETQAARMEQNIAQVAAGALGAEVVEEELASFRQRIPEGLPAAPSGIACPSCSAGSIRERSTAKGVLVYGCSRYPHCRFLAWGPPIAETCPQCSSPYLVAKKLLKANWAVCPAKACGYRRPLEK